MYLYNVQEDGRWCAGMGINQRVSLRKFIDDIKRWVDEDRSDEWIASALGTSSSSVQSFRSRNGIYRKDPGTVLAEPTNYEVYEGVLEPDGGPEGRPGTWFDPAIEDDPRWQGHWKRVGKVEVRLSPTKIILVGRSLANRPSPRSPRI
jgi:hypothetical protein